MPTTHERTAATTSALREVEAELVALIRRLDARVTALELRLGALVLGATCHPEWVSPGAGPAAKARRALVVETVIGAAGKSGMTFAQVAAYLHVPAARHDVLREDIAYLCEADRLVRTSRNHAKWRTP
jgi:hypothetical protein